MAIDNIGGTASKVNGSDKEYLITRFLNAQAQQKQQLRLTADEILKMFQETSASEKARLPWFKFARFGDVRSDKGSLRNDANVIGLNGLEGDYDGEKISFEEAVNLVRKAGIDAFVYTSPSYLPDRPRWRVVAVTSTEIPPGQHSRLMNRLNGILGGVLAPESWALSQAYYYGSVIGNKHNHQAIYLPGDPIDLRDDLPSITKEESKNLQKNEHESNDKSQKKKNARPSAVDQEEIDPRSVDALPEKLRYFVKTGDSKAWGNKNKEKDRSAGIWALLCYCARLKWTDEEILPFIIDPKWPSSEHYQDNRKTEQDARREIRRAREEVATRWEMTPQFRPVPNSLHNISKAISEMEVTFRYNEFADRILVDIPDNTFVGRKGSKNIAINDTIANGLRFAISDKYSFLPPRELFFDYVAELAARNTFHPIKQYLDGLKWDGKNRIDDWLIRHLGADDNEYTRAVGRIILVAGVRRIRQPGCKFDQIMVFVSEQQGLGKSEAILTMAVKLENFTDSLPLDAEDKEVIEKLRGVWLSEFPEMRGMSDKRIEHIKAFAARRVDRARAAYGHFLQELPRQCIFFGTTNDVRFLRDDQNRRFWPITVTKFIDINALRAERDQLWAEAAAAEATGESIILARELWETSAIIQETHRQSDSWEDVIGEVLGDMNGKIRSADIWKILDIEPGRQTQRDNVRIGQAMKKLGWEPKQANWGGERRSCYIKGTVWEREKQLIRIRGEFNMDTDKMQYVAEYCGEEKSDPQPDIFEET